MKFVKGFRIIEIPLGEGMPGSHYLYIKEHTGNKVSKDSSGRVLFVGNVEYRINMTNETIDEYLRLLFSRFGDIANVYVSVLSEDSTATSKQAHVEFTKKSSLKLALSAADSDYLHASKEVCEQFGVVIRKKSGADIKRMFPFYDRNAVELQEEVDAFMAQYDETESILRQEREDRLNQVDEDGFMPVKNR
jgi:RNA recognition motif-containing protein